MAKLDFAMPADSIRGMLQWQDLVATEDPSEAFLAGIASLRGHLFPVVDVARKFDLPKGARGRSPCIVAVEIQGANGPALVGFVADVVTEIVRARERDFSRGKLRARGRPRIVFDPQLVLGFEAVQQP